MKNFGSLKPILTIIVLVVWDIKCQEMSWNIDLIFFNKIDTKTEVNFSLIVETM